MDPRLRFSEGADLYHRAFDADGAARMARYVFATDLAPDRRGRFLPVVPGMVDLPLYTALPERGQAVCWKRHG